MYLATPGFSLGRFRDYFVHDQLGYLAIVKNFSEGLFAAVEPDTETGANTYPRMYYEAIGLVARVTGWDPIVAWNVCGMAVQLVLVGLLAGILVGLSRRWWVGLIAPVPFMLGTFSRLTVTGWYTPLESHAVIWGPFGILHTLNGESVSLSLAAICLLSLGMLWLRPARPRTRVLLTTLISLVLGGLANVQTYSFIAAIYLLAFGLATWVILRGRHYVLAALSVVLIPVVFLAGPTVADAGGQLPALVFGLLPAVPGMIALIVRSRGAVLLYCVAVVLGASPQVVQTVVGLVTGDPFLAYRVASNTKLGVPLETGLISGLALIVPLIVILAAAIWRKRPLWGAYALGAALAWVMLGTNDIWGANAEPYRLYMDVFFLVAATILPIGVLVLTDLWSARAGQVQPDPSGAEADAVAPAPAVTGRSVPRWAVLVAALLCVGIATVSLTDWWVFYRSGIARALMVTDSPRDQALTELAQQSARTHPGTLVMVDSCIDPRVLKVTSGVPIAYYHLGMAWPTDYDAIATIVSARLSGAIDRDAAIEGNATQVLTDSDCGDDWGDRYADDLVEQSSLPYTQADGSSGTITLWGLE
ncbi:Putative integral membrane protein [Cryobacterium arcticum]|uniref:Putative integral membrane protein n=2 Tax=Cryobacterium arcticum TaxID=670052 RepID=A0A1B1BG98_9MICO|nr:Putative integral membrane protein [Cryobacterium arcticum]